MGFLLGRKSDREQVEGSILFYLLFSFFKMKTLKFYSLSECQSRNTTLATIITLLYSIFRPYLFYHKTLHPFTNLFPFPPLRLLATTVLRFLWAQPYF